MNNIIEIKDLNVSFHTYAGKVQAVRGVDFNVGESEILAIVGESGCGKSVTAQTIMKLNPTPPSEIERGEIFFNGKDIVKLSEKEMLDIRGGKIGMIFQDPMTSLDPTKKIGYQMCESIFRHEKVTKEEAFKRSVEMLENVGIANAAERMNQYPHQFSGGMRQRVMIAAALVCNPKLLIADEPTTALDVTIQAQIIDLLLQVREHLNTSIIIITHDMGVVADIADRVAVMYAGKIIETGTVRELFYNPNHPYTWGLMNSIPSIHKERLTPIEGTPPDLIQPPLGCPFVDRCDHAMKVCQTTMPSVFKLTDTHEVRCWLKHPKAPKTEVKQCY